MLASLELSILLPAFVAGLLVIATHVPLGQRVLARGIVFIDIAIAQVASLGVIVADWIGWESTDWRVHLSATVAALLGATLLTWTERCWPEVQEALIGVLFVAAASISALLVAHDPHGGEHLKDLLVGQILWVRIADLGGVALLYAAVLLLWFGVVAGRGDTVLGRGGFYALFALAVTQSVQLVGLYLVFATLILPALAVRHLASQGQLWAGYACAIVGYVAGLILSAAFDWPTGPAIVCTLLLASLTPALVCRPAHGKFGPRA